MRDDRAVGGEIATIDGLFVGFSDDRGLEIVVWFGVLVIVIIIVVWVSRRHRIADNGEDGSVGQPGGNVVGDACGHVGSC
jgi:hypothetical protein